MKKRYDLYLIIYSICLLLSSSDLYADTRGGSSQERIERKDPLYMQLYGCINKSAN